MIAGNKRGLIFSILAAGFTSITVQIILLREFLVIFNGNELVYGIILANWMLISGVGSYLGRRADKMKNQGMMILMIQLLMGILPVIITFLLYYMRGQLFMPGKMLSVIEVFYISFLLLLPFCLISGSLFALLCAVRSSGDGKNRVGNVYGLESIGSMAGGALFNFLLVYYLEPFQCLAIVMAVNLVAAFITSSSLKGSWKYATVVLTGLLVFIMVHFDTGSRVIHYLFPDQQVVHRSETPYGKLVVTRTGDQLNVYENGVVLFTTNDVARAEESVHYAMVQSPEPKQVLLIGGGMTGVLEEIRKYAIERVDYVEINPWVVKAEEQFFGQVSDTSVHIHIQDARLFVHKTDERFNVVLINLPEPSTAQFNRYYSVEFFKALKRRLCDGGIVCTGLASSVNYMSGEALMTNSVLYNSLRSVFPHVIMIPGGRNFYLASDSALTYGIAEKIDQLGIGTVYVNRFYLNDDLIRARGEQVISSLDVGAGVNLDFKPVAYYHQLRLWLSYFHTGVTVPLIIVLVILVLTVAGLNPVSQGLFIGGFTSASVEFILIIAFQIIYGYVYQATGVIIMTFMAGLALGSLFVHRWLPRKDIRSYTFILLAFAVLCILLPLMVKGIATLQEKIVVVHAFFILMILVFSVLAGVQFRISSLLSTQQPGRLAGKLYAADLAGSAFGALLMAAFLLPLLGVEWSCLILGAMNLLAAVNVYFRR
jgi:spermidine synthase